MLLYAKSLTLGLLLRPLLSSGSAPESGFQKVAHVAHVLLSAPRHCKALSNSQASLPREDAVYHKSAESLNCISVAEARLCPLMRRRIPQVALSLVQF